MNVISPTALHPPMPTDARRMLTASVRPSIPEDIDGWLKLAREVEPLFGPMADVPEFRDALAAAIADGQALTSAEPAASSDSGDRVLGGIVISKAGNSIEWLVVSASARGLGIGGQLLRAALDRLDPAQPVPVQTFAPSISEGSAARHLYLKFGFEDDRPMDANPAGIATVLMLRRPRSRSGEAAAQADAAAAKMADGFAAICQDTYGTLRNR